MISLTYKLQLASPVLARVESPASDLTYTPQLRSLTVIVIEEKKDLLKATVYAEFTLADYQEFERAVTHGLAHVPKINVIIDLTNMAHPGTGRTPQLGAL